MAGRRGPTLRSMWVGQEMRRMREGSNLKLKDVAAYIQRDASSISRMESGVYPARVGDVLAYVNLCRIDDPDRREALVTMARDVWQTGWWDGYADDVAGSLIDKIWLESRAREIRIFQEGVIPGLIQTPEYAREIIRATHPDAADRQLSRWVDLRMDRQKVIGGGGGLRLSVLLDESVVRRPVGGGDISCAQLRHVSELTRRPDIEVRVVPLKAGAHAASIGSFEIFEMNAPYSDVGYVDTPAGAFCLEGEPVGRLVAAYDRAGKSALSPDDSVAFIDAVARDLS